MKTFRLISLLLTGFLFSSCLTTLLTVATASQQPVKTTTVVTTPAPVVYSAPVSTTTTVRTTTGRPTTTTVKVNAMTNDISLHLDLQAVAAAFAQSETVEEFEMILNSSRYMISNLDLNHDGFVDYLRVIEVVNSYNHVFVIQAVLAYNVFQNVATLTLEMGQTVYCQIVGDPYIYGSQYIVQPVFVKTPPLYSYLRRPIYNPWHSPYYWDAFPTWYAKPKPQYLSHYQAYVSTYIHNHKYCHEVTYPTVVHYTNYITVIQNVSRNDYQTAHPEESFDKRTSGMTYTPQGSTATRGVRNASDVRQAVVATSTTTSTSTSRTNAQAQKSDTSSSSGSSRSSSSSTASSSSSSRSNTATTSATSQRKETTTTTTRTSSSTSSPSRSTTSTTTKTTTTTSRSSSATVQPSRTTSTTSKVSNEGRVRTTSTTRTTVPVQTTSRSAAASSSSRSSNADSRSNTTDGSRNTGSSRSNSNR